ncbi:MAG: EAL domain-containing protein [Solirubrobacteraceae bacterium]|nr:EAL domain-containing protein [Solirubrobacteraceae bacterium]
MPDGATNPIAEGPRDDDARDRTAGRRTGAIVLVVGLIVATVVVAIIGQRIDDDRERERRENAASQGIAVVRVATARLQDTVRDLAGLYRASQNVTAREFFAFADPSLESGAVSALSVVEHVSSAERPAFEERIGRPIWDLETGRAEPAPDAPQYAVLTALASRSTTQSLRGANVYSEPARGEALRRAARSGNAAGTGVITLADSGRAGIVVYSPRYRRGVSPVTTAERLRALEGWVGGTLDERQLALELRPVVGDGGIRVSQGGHTLVVAGDLQADPVRTSLSIAGQPWSLEVSPPERDTISLAVALVAIGLIVTLLVALLLRQMLISEGRSHQVAQLRSRELREARRTQAADQAANQALLGHLPDIAVLRYDRDLRVTTAAGGLIPMSGWTSGQLVGRTPRELMDEAAAASVEPPMRAALDGAVQSFDLRDGERRLWVQTVPVAVGREALLVATDVSGLERAQAGRAEAEARFQQAFDDAPVGMSLVDMQGRFIEVNRALCELVGFTPEDLRGRSFTSLAHPDDVSTLSDTLRDQISGERVRVSTETRAVHAAGHTVWLEIHSTVLAGSDGRPEMLLSQILDVTDRRRFEARLQHMADHDPLTGLANRRAFERALDNQLAHVRRYGAQGALLVLDLDHFKAINDTLGHNSGDAVIVNAARILRELLRESDIIARLGGDEFAVLLPRAEEEEAVDVAEKLVEEIRAQGSVLAGQRPHSVTASVGVTLLDPVQETGEQALIDADLAMYDAKEAGRNSFALFRAGSATSHSRTKARLTWLERIRTALDQDRLVLVAQPIMSLEDDRIVHHELLLRMVGDDGELIPPAAFLDIAERFGLIGEIDEWVVCRAMRALAEHTDRDLIFEVNLSGVSIGSPRMLEIIERQLRETEVDPKRVIFEITETAAVANVPDARAFAERLGELGCRFALDDFGAGFGSFYYLKHLPCDFLKIDGEFVRNCASTPTDQVIIAGLVRIAKGLGKRTIAEFVEDAETLELLRREGVDMAQGYHVGKPAPLDEILRGAPGRA